HGRCDVPPGPDRAHRRAVRHAGDPRARAAGRAVRLRHGPAVEDPGPGVAHADAASRLPGGPDPDLTRDSGPGAMGVVTGRGAPEGVEGRWRRRSSRGPSRRSTSGRSATSTTAK